VIAEEFVDGQELTASILGDEALPLVRIEAPQGNYDYQNKYFSDETRTTARAGLPDARSGDPGAGAARAALLGCRGWGRADLMLRADGSVSLLEMNTSPGMTGHSLVPMAARAPASTSRSWCCASWSWPMWDRPAPEPGRRTACTGRAVLALCAGLLLTAIRSPVFPLREVEVPGRHRAHHARADRAVAAARAARQLLHDRLDASRGASRSCRGCASARCAGVWPDRLEVTLEEHVPLARWGARRTSSSASTSAPRRSSRSSPR
jgi:hypothetical protein